MAASGPATPSIAPLPNSSGRFASFFSAAYDRNVDDVRATGRHGADREADDVPRSHGFHERDQNSRVIHLPPIGMTSIGPCRSRDATYSASPTANTPTATTTTSIPSARVGHPEGEALLTGQRVGADQADEQAERQRREAARRPRTRAARATVMNATTISAT